MENQFVGMKELYDVNIRLLRPLEIGGIKYDRNEAVLNFKRAEIAQLQQLKREVSARGGYHNPALVNWEVDREVQFIFTNGVLSPVSWALLSNSKIKEPQSKSVQYYEELHVIENGDYSYVDLKFCPNNCEEKLGAQPNPYGEPLPMGRRNELILKPLPPSNKKWIFIYDCETGRRIRDFQIYMNRIYLQEQAKEVVVDYTFCYQDKIKTIELGNRLSNGFYKLDGNVSIKNDKNGEVTTGIIELPKIKLNSNLSLKLGMNYDNSTVDNFYFTGYPNEEVKREDQAVAYFTFLNRELTEEYL